jgi:threonine aldolase
MRHLISDNNSGVHPEVMLALQRAGEGSAGSYGDDPCTREALDRLRDVFGEGSTAFFVFLGTAANALGLQCLLKPFESVICAECAHIHTDECGALEAAGRKIQAAPHTHGKIGPEQCEPFLRFAGSVHHSLPRVVSVTQSTEYGCLYTLDELRELAAFCHSHRLYLHMDGARLANAATALGVDLRAASRDVGVDALSFGGTKNGLMFGDAVIFLHPGLGEEFAWHQKRGMQLASKMRFVAAQFVAYLSKDLWRRNAARANETARILGGRLAGMEALRLTHPVQANAVFVRMPWRVVRALQRDYALALWDERPDPDSRGPVDGPEVRIMTSFDTTPEAVADLAEAVAGALASHSRL